MGFGSAIGGAYTGSVVMGASMDASKYSTDKIVSENNKAIGSASQMETSLANAAAMQELLAAKQLAAITKVNAIQRSRPGMTGMMSAAGSGRPLFVDRPDTASGGMASAWGRTIAVEQAARQRADELSYQISIRLQQNLSSYVIAQIREQQAARQAAIREEFVFRQNQERNMSAQIMQNIRAQQAAASGRRRAGAQETIEGIRNQQFARSAGIAESIGLGRNTPASLNAAQQAIARMRADLNPMVGMEMRLAEEAREVRNYIVQRVAAGKMEVAEARQLTAEFQHHANLLRQRAAHEHQGFLGMRRMGFAAQQLGYAVEDAASQFGTMGLAGAIRAAGNNLTAMAAQRSATAGVTASFASAALALALNWWQARKALAETKKETEDLKKVSDELVSAHRFELQIQNQTFAARKANHDALMGMYDENLQKLREIREEEIARIAAVADLSDVEATRAAAAKAHQAALDATEQNLREGFRWTIAIGTYLKDAAIGIWDAMATDASKKAAADAQAAQDRLDVAMQRQLNHLKKINSEEYKRDQLLKSQEARLNNMAVAMSGRAFGIAANLGGRAGERARAVFEGNGLGNLSENQMAMRFGAIEQTRNAMQQQLAAGNLTLQQREQILENIADLETQLDAIEKERWKRNVDGEQAMQSMNQLLMQRFESLNSELAFENEILRTRKKLNEEIDKGVASGHLNAEQAASARAEVEKILRLEEQTRQGQQALDRLAGEEQALLEEARTKGTPAGIAGAVKKGSDEAARIIESEKLRRMAAKDQEPVVNELRRVKAAIEAQKAALEAIAAHIPQVATIP